MGESKTTVTVGGSPYEHELTNPNRGVNVVRIVEHEGGREYVMPIPDGKPISVSFIGEEHKRLHAIEKAARALVEAQDVHFGKFGGISALAEVNVERLGDLARALGLEPQTPPPT